ncbi:hypothetical protein FHG87_014828 [Trinorchestia longiramus]|nr:hypothetical protein FHG87_014828 [Trinorchestia longiramus]
MVLNSYAVVLNSCAVVLNSCAVVLNSCVVVLNSCAVVLNSCAVVLNSYTLMRSAMISRIFLVVVMSLDIYALDTSPRGQADVAQVLTKCLGRETLLRWQRQLVAASRFCGGEALLVEQDPAPLSSPSVLPAAAPPGAPADAPPVSDVPISLEQQQSNKGVLTPLTVGTSNQPFIPSKTYPLYFQKFTFPYFLPAPYTLSKYYFVKVPQSPTKNTILPSQQFYPFTFNVQKTSPDGRFSFVPNVPGFSKPVVHYYPVRKPGDNQYYYQPFEAQAPQQVPASVPHPAGEAVQRRVITHDMTFTDPRLKFEDTEQYQREQEILAALRQNTTTEQGLWKDSSEHFRGGIGRPLKKQKREADALSVFMPATSSMLRSWPTSPETEQVARERHFSIVRSRAEEKLGNMTCVLKAMKALTDNLEPNHDFIGNSLLELPVSHDVYEELRNSQEYCKKFSQCLPERKKINGIEMSSNLSKAFEFFRCYGREKVRVCLQSDSLTLADMLNRNFVPRDTVYYPRRSKLGQTLGEVDQLLNGAGSQFLDLVLL